MNRILHLAPMSFLETVKWLWPECQIDHPSNCGIWTLSLFIFAITQSTISRIFLHFFLLYDSSFFLFVIIISWCFFLLSSADKGIYLNLIYSTWRVLLGHETPLQALTIISKSYTKKTSNLEKRKWLLLRASPSKLEYLEVEAEHPHLSPPSPPGPSLPGLHLPSSNQQRTGQELPWVPPDHDWRGRHVCFNCPSLLQL